jgi:hypothetical protein
MKKILFALVFFFPVFLFAQAGLLDDTFGDEGKMLTPTAGYCYGVALQSDGKIIAAGGGINKLDSGFLLIRYLPDGSIDESFGEQGKVILDLPDYDVASFYAVAFCQIIRLLLQAMQNFLTALVRITI